MPKGQVIAFESVARHQREGEFIRLEKDTRYSPSYVDVGTLQLRACQLSAMWRIRGSEPFPKNFLSDVEHMVQESVRGVEQVHIRDLSGGHKSMTFTTQDEWGTYSFSFLLKLEWFRKN